MRTQLARDMQLRSYGPSQRDRASFRIPHAREREDTQTNKECSSRKPRKKSTWGGARNRKDRVSTELSQQQAEGILKAMAVAELKGMPLNRHWTVDYALSGIPDGEGAAFVGKLLGFCNRYARAREGKFAAVWVREVGERNGAHVHIAMHLPADWKLGHLTRKWIKAAGGRYLAGNSRIRSIGGSLRCPDTNPCKYRANQEALGNYLVKGSGPCVADELGLERLKPSGAIIGKRCGWTQNLGAAAR